jgi:hypothetical protein
MKNAKSEALKKKSKMVSHPLGGRMREGSKKQRYWAMLDRIKKDSPNGEHQL